MSGRLPHLLPGCLLLSACLRVLAEGVVNRLWHLTKWFDGQTRASIASSSAQVEECCFLFLRVIKVPESHMSYACMHPFLLHPHLKLSVVPAQLLASGLVRRWEAQVSELQTQKRCALFSSFRRKPCLSLIRTQRSTMGIVAVSLSICEAVPHFSGTFVTFTLVSYSTQTYTSLSGAFWSLPLPLFHSFQQLWPALLGEPKPMVVLTCSKSKTFRVPLHHRMPIGLWLKQTIPFRSLSSHHALIKVGLSVQALASCNKFSNVARIPTAWHLNWNRKSTRISSSRQASKSLTSQDKALIWVSCCHATWLQLPWWLCE